jgi:hypothetical protein
VAGPAFLFAIIAQSVFHLWPDRSFASDAAVILVVAIAQSLVLTPLAIAVQRYVLLDEVAPHYALDLGDPRFRRFFRFVIAIQAPWLGVLIWLILADFVFGALWTGQMIREVEWRAWVLAAFALAGLVTFWIGLFMVLSVVILLPAIVVDAPGARWPNANVDSNGHGQRIGFTLWLAIVPVSPLLVVADWVLEPQKFGSPLGLQPALQTIGVVLSAAAVVLIVSVLAAVASRLYMSLGRRLNEVAPAG